MIEKTSSSRENPLVSVLMPVYNAENYLRESIDSILKQTYKNIELIIIDDASTDNSWKIIQSYKDKRMRLIRNKRNLMVAKNMNKGVQISRGKYVARMDADDISRPHRIKDQVDFLERNLEIGLVGGWVRLFGDELEGKVWVLPTKPDRVKHDLIFSNTIAQPTVMIRRKLLVKNKLKYSTDKLINKQKCEDYDLWTRCFDVFQGANINKVLLDYRVTKQKIHKDIKEQDSPKKIRERQIKKYGFKLTLDELSIHQLISTQQVSNKNINEAEKWLLKLGKRRELKKTVANQWYLISRYNCSIGFELASKLLLSRLFIWLPLLQKWLIIKNVALKLGSNIKQRYTD